MLILSSRVYPIYTPFAAALPYTANIGGYTVTRRDLLAFALASVPVRAQRGERAVFLSFADAHPILEDFAHELPSGLEESVSAEAWPSWEQARDTEIRSRLKRGDADSIVNLVLYGTSFTTRPRLANQNEAPVDSEETARLILARIQDFARAVTHPAGPERLNNDRPKNERLEFAAAWLKDNGVDALGPDADKRVIVVLLENTRRVLKEQRAFDNTLEAAKKRGDAGSVFVTRSSLYRERGLSLDTSFRPNYAIERSLAEIKAAGMLRDVRRAAVIGPGLDFTDKRAGYDFYPVQTLQPFALVDSLRRLKLADASGPSVEIVDLSARVLDHVGRAVAQAAKGASYTVQLPLDRDLHWLAESSGYWEGFGSEIGSSARPLAPPAGVNVRTRAVRIRPDVVKLLRPVDLNVVLQHLTLADDQKFDLMIATNVMLYYEPFEQALALKNIAAVLRPGGLLLVNNALPESKAVPMKPVGGTSVAYSDDADDGDHLLWYRRT